MSSRRSIWQRILPCAVPTTLGLGVLALMNQPPGSDSTATVRSASESVEISAKAVRSAVRNSQVATKSSLTRLPENDSFRNLIRSVERAGNRWSVDETRKLFKSEEGAEFSLNVGGNKLSGKLLSKQIENGISRLSAKLSNDEGIMTVSLRDDQTIMGSVMFNGESHALLIRGKAENGYWPVQFGSIDQVLCTPAGTTYPPKRDAAMPRAKSAKAGKSLRSRKNARIPNLSSNPDSSNVLYMDFDGEVVTAPEWTQFTGGPINCLPSTRAGDDEYIRLIYERVIEDYAGFDVNVTTDRAVYDAASPSQRMMCIMTPTDDAAPGAGGVALLDSFGFDLPCFAFNDGEAAAAETVSHEIGHTFGLIHDGQINGFEYYGGHGTGAVSWAPIMGAYFADFDPPFVDEELTQWSRGEYPDANNQEDDIATIAGSVGFLDDDHGNASGDATIVIAENDALDTTGVIEQSTDEDWFLLATSGGSVDLQVNAKNVESTEDPQRGANLAVSITLYDSDGAVLEQNNPVDQIDANISRQLREGIYYLKVEGAGRGDLVTGFSDYASLGQYTLSGTLPQTGLISVDPESIDVARGGAIESFRVLNGDSWSWSTDSTWITSDESRTQTGERTFTYRVARNPSRDPRVGTITVTDGIFSAVHTVNQFGSANDDHGDTFDDATLVDDVDSSTPGVFEEAGDIDMFRIDVEEFGKLTVSTSGATDTIGVFYDSNGRRLQSDDQGLSPNFLMTQEVSRGAYYVAVRHAVDGGTGSYTFNTSFKSTSALLIDPKKRRVGPSGGNFLVNVIVNREWTWETDAKWLTLKSSGTRTGGGLLSYRVQPNNTNKKRRANIIFRSRNKQVKHIIVQSASDGDDHADDLKNASELLANGRQEGEIQFEGDADMFRIALGTSGTLQVKASGRIDSVGELLDENGDLITKVDGGNGDNFVIQREMNAGVYFLRVTSFGVAVGNYKLRSTYDPSQVVNVEYSASKGGRIRGNREQVVQLAGDANRVEAIPRKGYSFTGWSDGFKEAKRFDRGLISHLDVVAEFAQTIRVTYSNGAIRPNDTIPVDYGLLNSGKGRSITFRIKNQGRKTLKNLSIAPFGAGSTSQWKLRQPNRKTLKKGKSARFTIRLDGRQAGFQQASWAITAKGMNRRFVLRTMGVVGSQVAVRSASSQTGGVSPGTRSKSTPASELLPWVDVSPDGYFRYRFERDAGDKSEQTFWISTNATSWEEALVLDVWKTRTSPDTNHFEAILAPPSIPAPRILIVESEPERN